MEPFDRLRIDEQRQKELPLHFLSCLRKKPWVQPGRMCDQMSRYRSDNNNNQQQQHEEVEVVVVEEEEEEEEEEENNI